MKLISLLIGALALAVQGALITRGSSSSTSTLIGKASSKTSCPHGYPLCGIPNSDLRVGPGNTAPEVHQQSGSNLRTCVQQCRTDIGDTGRGPCASVLFEDRYTMCSFYDVPVENTTQVDDGRFRFTSWDKDCYVG